MNRSRTSAFFLSYDCPSILCTLEPTVEVHEFFPQSSSIRVTDQNNTDWMREDILAVRELVDLPPNWDGDGALAIEEKVVTSAMNVVRLLSEQYKERVALVAPGANGEIMLMLKRGDKETEIILYPSREVYVNFHGKEYASKGDFNPANLDVLLAWLNS